MKRRIRVHVASESTFVIESTDGMITYCSRGYGVRVREQADPSGFVGKPELDVARELRANGALFVDLDNLTTVRPGRGYAARGDRGRPYQRATKPARKPVDATKGATLPGSKQEAAQRPPVVNATMTSLRNWSRPVEDVQLPGDDDPPF